MFWTTSLLLSLTEPLNTTLRTQNGATCKMNKFAKYKRGQPQQTHLSVEFYAGCHLGVQEQLVM